MQKILAIAVLLVFLTNPLAVAAQQCYIGGEQSYIDNIQKGVDEASQQEKQEKFDSEFQTVKDNKGQLTVDGYMLLLAALQEFGNSNGLDTTAIDQELEVIEDIGDVRIEGPLAEQFRDRDEWNRRLSEGLFENGELTDDGRQYSEFIAGMLNTIGEDAYIDGFPMGESLARVIGIPSKPIINILQAIKELINLEDGKITTPKTYGQILQDLEAKMDEVVEGNQGDDTASTATRDFARTIKQWKTSGEMEEWLGTKKIGKDKELKNNFQAKHLILGILQQMATELMKNPATFDAMYDKEMIAGAKRPGMGVHYEPIPGAVVSGDDLIILTPVAAPHLRFVDQMDAINHGPQAAIMVATLRKLMEQIKGTAKHNGKALEVPVSQIPRWGATVEERRQNILSYVINKDKILKDAGFPAGKFVTDAVAYYDAQAGMLEQEGLYGHRFITISTDDEGNRVVIERPGGTVLGIAPAYRPRAPTKAPYYYLEDIGANSISDYLDENYESIAQRDQADVVEEIIDKLTQELVETLKDENVNIKDFESIKRLYFGTNVRQRIERILRSPLAESQRMLGRALQSVILDKELYPGSKPTDIALSDGDGYMEAARGVENEAEVKQAFKNIKRTALRKGVNVFIAETMIYFSKLMKENADRKGIDITQDQIHRNLITQKQREAIKMVLEAPGLMAEAIGEAENLDEWKTIGDAFFEKLAEKYSEYGLKVKEADIRKAFDFTEAKKAISEQQAAGKTGTALAQGVASVLVNDDAIAGLMLDIYQGHQSSDWELVANLAHRHRELGPQELADYITKMIGVFAKEFDDDMTITVFKGRTANQIPIIASDEQILAWYAQAEQGYREVSRLQQGYTKTQDVLTLASKTLGTARPDEFTGDESRMLSEIMKLMTREVLTYKMIDGLVMDLANLRPGTEEHRRKMMEIRTTADELDQQAKLRNQEFIDKNKEAVAQVRDAVAYVFNRIAELPGSRISDYAQAQIKFQSALRQQGGAVKAAQVSQSTKVKQVVNKYPYERMPDTLRGWLTDKQKQEMRTPLRAIEGQGYFARIKDLPSETVEEITTALQCGSPCNLIVQEVRKILQRISDIRKSGEETVMGQTKGQRMYDEYIKIEPLIKKGVERGKLTQEDVRTINELKADVQATVKVDMARDMAPYKEDPQIVKLITSVNEQTKSAAPTEERPSRTMRGVPADTQQELRKAYSALNQVTGKREDYEYVKRQLETMSEILQETDKAEVIDEIKSLLDKIKNTMDTSQYGLADRIEIVELDIENAREVEEEVVEPELEFLSIEDTLQEIDEMLAQLELMDEPGDFLDRDQLYNQILPELEYINEIIEEAKDIDAIQQRLTVIRNHINEEFREEGEQPYAEILEVIRQIENKITKEKPRYADIEFNRFEQYMKEKQGMTDEEAARYIRAVMEGQYPAYEDMVEEQELEGMDMESLKAEHAAIRARLKAKGKLAGAKVEENPPEQAYDKNGIYMIQEGTVLKPRIIRGMYEEEGVQRIITQDDRGAYHTYTAEQFDSLRMIVPSALSTKVDIGSTYEVDISGETKTVVLEKVYKAGQIKASAVVRDAQGNIHTITELYDENLKNKLRRLRETTPETVKLGTQKPKPIETVKSGLYLDAVYDYQGQPYVLESIEGDPTKLQTAVIRRLSDGESMEIPIHTFFEGAESARPIIDLKRYVPLEEGKAWTQTKQYAWLNMPNFIATYILTDKYQTPLSTTERAKFMRILLEDGAAFDYYLKRVAQLPREISGTLPLMEEELSSDFQDLLLDAQVEGIEIAGPVSEEGTVTAEEVYEGAVYTTEVGKVKVISATEDTFTVQYNDGTKETVEGIYAYVPDDLVSETVQEIRGEYCSALLCKGILEDAISALKKGNTPKKYDVDYIVSGLEAAEATGTPLSVEQARLLIQLREELAKAKPSQTINSLIDQIDSWSETPVGKRAMQAAQGRELPKERTLIPFYRKSKRAVEVASILEYDMGRKTGTVFVGGREFRLSLAEIMNRIITAEELMRKELDLTQVQEMKEKAEDKEPFNQYIRKQVQKLPDGRYKFTSTRGTEREVLLTDGRAMFIEQERAAAYDLTRLRKAERITREAETEGDIQKWRENIAEVAMMESIGGPMREGNRYAVNMYIDRDTGRILAVGNVQDIPREIVEAPNSAEVTIRRSLAGKTDTIYVRRDTISEQALNNFIITLLKIEEREDEEIEVSELKEIKALEPDIEMPFEHPEELEKTEREPQKGEYTLIFNEGRAQDFKVTGVADGKVELEQEAIKNVREARKITVSLDEFQELEQKALENVVRREKIGRTEINQLEESLRPETKREAEELAIEYHAEAMDYLVERFGDLERRRQAYRLARVFDIQSEQSVQNMINNIEDSDLKNNLEFEDLAELAALWKMSDMLERRTELTAEEKEALQEFRTKASGILERDRMGKELKQTLEMPERIVRPEFPRPRFSQGASIFGALGIWDGLVWLKDVAVWGWDRLFKEPTTEVPFAVETPILEQPEGAKPLEELVDTEYFQIRKPSENLMQRAAKREVDPTVTRGYSELVKSIDRDAEHSLPLEERINSRIPEELIERLRQGQDIYLHEGLKEDAIAAMMKQGYTDFTELYAFREKPTYTVWIARDEQGREAYFISSIRGKSRMNHIQAMLYLSRVPEEQIIVNDHNFDYKQEFASLLESLETPPDVVILGEQGVLAEGYLKAGKDAVTRKRALQEAFGEDVNKGIEDTFSMGSNWFDKYYNTQYRIGAAKRILHQYLRSENRKDEKDVMANFKTIDEDYLRAKDIPEEIIQQILEIEPQVSKEEALQKIEKIREDIKEMLQSKVDLRKAHEYEEYKEYYDQYKDYTYADILSMDTEQVLQDRTLAELMVNIFDNIYRILGQPEYDLHSHFTDLVDARKSKAVKRAKSPLLEGYSIDIDTEEGTKNVYITANPYGSLSGHLVEAALEKEDLGIQDIIFVGAGAALTDNLDMYALYAPTTIEAGDIVIQVPNRIAHEVKMGELVTGIQFTKHASVDTIFQETNQFLNEIDADTLDVEVTHIVEAYNSHIERTVAAMEWLEETQRQKIMSQLMQGEDVTEKDLEALGVAQIGRTKETLDKLPRLSIIQHVSDKPLADIPLTGFFKPPGLQREKYGNLIIKYLYEDRERGEAFGSKKATQRNVCRECGQLTKELSNVIETAQDISSPLKAKEWQNYFEHRLNNIQRRIPKVPEIVEPEEKALWDKELGEVKRFLAILKSEKSRIDSLVDEVLGENIYAQLRKERLETTVSNLKKRADPAIGALEGDIGKREWWTEKRVQQLRILSESFKRVRSAAWPDLHQDQRYLENEVELDRYIQLIKDLATRFNTEKFSWMKYMDEVYLSEERAPKTPWQKVDFISAQLSFLYDTVSTDLDFVELHTLDDTGAPLDYRPYLDPNALENPQTGEQDRIIAVEYVDVLVRPTTRKGELDQETIARMGLQPDEKSGAYRYTGPAVFAHGTTDREGRIIPEMRAHELGSVQTGKRVPGSPEATEYKPSKGLQFDRYLETVADAFGDRTKLLMVVCNPAAGYIGDVKNTKGENMDVLYASSEVSPARKKVIGDRGHQHILYEANSWVTNSIQPITGELRMRILKQAARYKILKEDPTLVDKQELLEKAIENYITSLWNNDMVYKSLIIFRGREREDVFIAEYLMELYKKDREKLLEYGIEDPTSTIEWQRRVTLKTPSFYGSTERGGFNTVPTE